MLNIRARAIRRSLFSLRIPAIWLAVATGVHYWSWVNWDLLQEYRYIMAKASTGTRRGERRRTASDPTALGRQFKKRLKSRDILLGGTVLEYMRPSLIKLYRHAGFDFIYMENEHSTYLGPEFTDFVLSARDNGFPVIAKTGQLERAEVARLLEAGVVGVQLPRTNSRDDLEELIDIMKFPPLGSRAGAPCYGNVDYLWPTDDVAWLRKANESTVVVGHIETAEAFENAEEIISTPQLDMIYLGPYDFSISMGYPGEYDHPNVKRAMQRILDLCLKYEVPFGTTASGAKSGAGWVKKGCRFFELVDEMTLIRSGAVQMVDDYRKRYSR